MLYIMNYAVQGIVIVVIRNTSLGWKKLGILFYINYNVLGAQGTRHSISSVNCFTKAGDSLELYFT